MTPNHAVDSECIACITGILTATLRPSGYEPDGSTDVGDNSSDPLRCCLHLFVMDVCVAQCHRNLAMTEQLCNRRQRDALHDRPGGKVVAQIVKPDILDPGTFTNETPE